MPEEGFTAVTLPVKLVEAVKELVAKHAELGYTSVAEFVKAAIRDKLDLQQGRATFITGIGLVDRVLREHPELGPVLRVPSTGVKTAIFLKGDRPRFVSLETGEGLHMAAKEYEEHLRHLAARGEIQESAIEPAVKEFVRQVRRTAGNETKEVAAESPPRRTRKRDRTR